ncbi:MAG TPA: AMP-binding protein [Gemmatimonadaceae bacterium]|nr:AMP-binding protein [Gemmatimonadaceae bacterium]
MALLPLAAAAAGGRVGEYEAQQLVAAGLTLLGRCAPLVRALSGRRSAILLPTSPAFLTALAASEGRGAVLINPLAAPPEIAHQLADANVGAVFTIGALASRLPPGVPRVLLDDAPRGARWLDGGASRDIDLGTHFGLDLAGESDAPGRDEEAAIVYTSGMAGVPLGAILSHRALLANARATVEAAALTPDDRTLAVLPFSHLFGLTVTLAAPLLAGGTVLPAERFSPARAVEAIARDGVTVLVGVPAVIMALLQVIERRGGALRDSALRLCLCGGAVLPAEVQDRWHEATGVELRQGYGLTEAGPVCLFNRVQLPNHRGTLGVPFPGVELSIRDPASGAALPAGDTGEIWVAGDNLFSGYVRGGEQGLHCEGRWLRTGDLASADAEGFVTFRGLLKAMFTRSGFNIYPAEIARVAMAMPGVRAARVRAIPNPARENDIALEVAGDVEEGAVRRWCEERLSAYKQPTEVSVTRGAARA